jgi:hypothetical protein
MRRRSTRLPPRRRTTPSCTPRGQGRHDDPVRSGRRLDGPDRDGKDHRPHPDEGLAPCGLAQVRPISTSEYKKLVSQGGAPRGWVGETDARGATNTPAARRARVRGDGAVRQPLRDPELLDDAIVDIGQWLGDEVSITFAEQEGAAFITGNGVKKPRGILSYTDRRRRELCLGQDRLRRDRRRRLRRRPGGLDTLIDGALRAEEWLPPERQLADEPQDHRGRCGR